MCVCVRPDYSIDNSLLRPERRLASLKKALNKQRIETERWNEEGRVGWMGAGECLLVGGKKQGKQMEGN